MTALIALSAVALLLAALAISIPAALVAWIVRKVVAFALEE
jgi:hypothetical protein